MRSTTISRAVATVATLLFGSVSATFNANANSNVAMYWGQGSNQIPLLQLCQNPSVDVVILGFVNSFPTFIGDYPGDNFANACGDAVYSRPGGAATGLHSSCPSIGPAITSCQQIYGKKVLLSIGGSYPTDYTLATTALAQYFAEFLWGAFGPEGPSAPQSWIDAGSPRPFGSAVVDGFDFDIESYQASPPFADYQSRGYGDMINHFKNNLFPTAAGSYYISGAPQCIVPDSHLDAAIQTSHFDFLFVQFYNTPQCSARAGYNGLSTTTTAFTFDQWVSRVQSNSANPSVKIYLGLPAGTAGAPGDTASYLNVTEANALISTYLKKYPSTFGGVMLWEATVSYNNQICCKDYSTWIKQIVTAASGNSYFDSSCPAASAALCAPSSTSTSSATPT
ncbi:glycoside hydrolase family 18 protein, partial [Lepidopterella palustris CBS 459.81]